MKRDIKRDPTLVAYCGLYCGACGAYLKGRCTGCQENVKAKWCKVRACCAEHSYNSCADCKDFADPNDCRKFNNLIAKVIGVVLNSNRQACVLKIREMGLDGFAAFMAEQKRQTLPRRGR
jgi:hypothetical protein